MVTTAQAYRRAGRVYIVPAKYVQMLSSYDMGSRSNCLNMTLIAALESVPSSSIPDMDNDTEVHFCQQGGSLAIPKREFEWNLEGSANHTAWPLRASGCFVRRDVALMFSAQAQKLGIPSKFGVGVTNYLENSAMGLGIIHTDDGRELSADIVVAADGFGTESHFVVVDYPTRAVSTGYCVYYPTSMLKNAPALSKALAEIRRPQWRMYNGKCSIFSPMYPRND